jgi:hypothetical protein
MNRSPNLWNDVGTSDLTLEVDDMTFHVHTAILPESSMFRCESLGYFGDGAKRIMKLHLPIIGATCEYVEMYLKHIYGFQFVASCYEIEQRIILYMIADYFGDEQMARKYWEDGVRPDSMEVLVTHEETYELFFNMYCRMYIYQDMMNFFALQSDERCFLSIPDMALNQFADFVRSTSLMFELRIMSEGKEQRVPELIDVFHGGEDALRVLQARPYLARSDYHVPPPELPNGQSRLFLDRGKIDQRLRWLLTNAEFKRIENNRVYITGAIVEACLFSHVQFSNTELDFASYYRRYYENEEVQFIEVGGDANTTLADMLCDNPYYHERAAYDGLHLYVTPLCLDAWLRRSLEVPFREGSACTLDYEKLLQWVSRGYALAKRAVSSDLTTVPELFSSASGLDKLPWWHILYQPQLWGQGPARVISADVSFSTPTS